MDVTKNSSASVQEKLFNSEKFTSRPLYGNFSILLLGLILISVLPHYFKLYDAPASVPLAIVVHSIFYLAWFVLFAVQANLIGRKNYVTHKKLGYLSLVLFVVLVVSGAQLLLGVMHSYDPAWDQWYLQSRSSFVLAIFHTLISFAAFYCLGVFYRKNSHAHKRFMLMASLSMIAASVTRVAFLPMIPVSGMLLTLGITYVLLLTPMIMDRLYFKRVHPVYKWGVPVYIVSQIVFIGVLPATPVGREIAFPF